MCCLFKVNLKTFRWSREGRDLWKEFEAVFRTDLRQNLSAVPCSAQLVPSLALTGLTKQDQCFSSECERCLPLALWKHKMFALVFILFIYSFIFSFCRCDWHNSTDFSLMCLKPLCAVTTTWDSVTVAVHRRWLGLIKLLSVLSICQPQCGMQKYWSMQYHCLFQVGFQSFTLFEILDIQVFY